MLAQNHDRAERARITAAWIARVGPNKGAAGPSLPRCSVDLVDLVDGSSLTEVGGVELVAAQELMKVGAIAPRQLGRSAHVAAGTA